MRQKGFTTIELLIVVAIIAVIAAMAVQSFFSMKKKTDVDTATQEFVTVVALAKNKTVSSENNAQYGVYLNTATTPHQYILFKGGSYATRDMASDTTYSLPATVEFYGISLGSVNEIVFNKLNGTSGKSGSLIVRNKADTNESKTLYLETSGVISVASANLSDVNRVTDSRHIRFDYSRTIDTATESVVLNFNNTVTESVPMSTNLVGGQFTWSGTITVGGTDQTVSVTTLRLNDPDTQFNIHRDGRYNDKSLTVSLSGDASGYLVSYSADGLTTTHTSNYVSNFAWQ